MKNFTYLPLLVGTVLFFVAGITFAATDDYTNYYTFDEGTGRSVGDSKGGQNGTFTGTSTGFGWASGQVGTALGMDGMQGESVTLPDGFLAGSAGSIVLWFKMNSLSDREILFSARSTIDNYIYAALRVNYEGRPEFVFRATRDGADQKVQGAGILNKNEWYQLVFTANSVGYHMFLNGEEVAVTGYNIGRWFSDLTPHTLTYHIGSLDSNVLSGVFDGYLDDLRIYGRALTQTDVTALYNGGNPGTPAVPLAARALSVEASVSPVPVTEVALDVTTTPSVVASSSANVAPVVTETPLSADAARKAKIQELINLILVLIGELQKQLAVMKGQS